MRVPEHVARIEPYVPGKPVEELERELGIGEAVKLASNENPVGPSPRALEAAGEALAAVHRYPDGGAYRLRNALAERLGVRPEAVLPGNGSNELIELAVRTFLAPGDEAVMASPSFVVYDTVVRAAGGRSLPVPLKDGRHDTAAMRDALTERTRIVFVANPNNPTGTIVGRSEVEVLVDALGPDRLLVMDEAYYEYVTAPEFPDCPSMIRRGANLLLLRTFSKAYGLAGLRVGYAVGPPDVIAAMNRIRQPFNCNAVAQAAALAALEDEEHLRHVVELNRSGRRDLEEAFGRLGLRWHPSEANFVFVELPDGLSADEAYRFLLHRGVIVRPMGGRALRVTVGLPEENRRFLAGFEALLGEAR